MEECSNILQLAELLNVKTFYNCSDSEEEELPDDEGKDNDTIASNIENSTKSKDGKKITKEEKERDNIYKKIEKKVTLEEFESFSENSSNDDWKKTPQWDLNYKQSVTPSDVFLQMSGKNPSSMSCEDMVITVQLPNEKYPNIDLKVEKDNLNLISPRYKLNIPLPHPIDPQLGNAKWDNEAEKLIITLKMNREFDFVNF